MNQILNQNHSSRLGNPHDSQAYCTAESPPTWTGEAIHTRIRAGGGSRVGVCVLRTAKEFVQEEARLFFAIYDLLITFLY